MKKCKINKCPRIRRYVHLKLCDYHYLIHRRENITGICSTRNCTNKIAYIKRRLCPRCYFRKRARNTLKGVTIPYCSVEGCNRCLWAKGVCIGHYHQIRNYGKITKVELGKMRLRPHNGFYITSNGYKKIRVPDGRWILEHRFILEKKLGRPLLPSENVHHKDSNKLNNRLSNLELWVTGQPAGTKIGDLIKWAKKILRLYDRCL